MSQVIYPTSEEVARELVKWRRQLDIGPIGIEYRFTFCNITPAFKEFLDFVESIERDRQRLKLLERRSQSDEKG